VTPDRLAGLRAGLRLYRNHDHAFLRQVERSRPVRTMRVRLRLETVSGGLALHAEDEDGNHASGLLPGDWPEAEKPDQAAEGARKQLARMGNTPFECVGLELAWERPVFVPVAALNSLRRETLERLAAERAANRPVVRAAVQRNDIPYPETRLTYRGNVLNRQAAAFYRRHGVSEIEPAAESGLELRGRGVMRSRYCLKHQLGLCDGRGHRTRVEEPLWLVDEEKHRYRLRFDCAACEMEVIY
jgi:putative protease